MDSRHLESLIQDHQTSLLRYAARLLSDPEEARDVVQDTFVRYFKAEQKSLSAFRPDNPLAYLYRTARNLCYDRLRSRKRRGVNLEAPETLERIPDPAATPDRKASDKEEKERMREAIANLDDRSREVLMLKLDHEKSYREIAEITGLSVGNVGFILHHAIRKLKVTMLNPQEGV